jgi:hypothetical protein
LVGLALGNAVVGSGLGCQVDGNGEGDPDGCHVDGNGDGAPVGSPVSAPAARATNANAKAARA